MGDGQEEEPIDYSGNPTVGTSPAYGEMDTEFPNSKNLRLLGIQQRQEMAMTLLPCPLQCPC